MKNILSTILSAAGAVLLFAGFAGIVNLLFDTRLGVGTLTGSASTGAIPGDPVIIVVLLLLGAVCLGIEFLRGRNRSQNAGNQI